MTTTSVRETDSWGRFRRVAAMRRDAPALIEGDVVLTFGALEAIASGAARRLADAGLQPGDRCVFWAENSADMAAGVLAVMAARGVSTILHSASPPSHFERAAALTKARIALVDEPREAAAAAFDGPKFTLSALSAGAAEEAAGFRAAPAATLTEPASIVFTSGSSGLPKGVTQSHANLLWGADTVAEALGVSAEDRILCAIPWAFDYGWGQLLSTFFRGATQILPAGRGSGAAPEAMERDRPTILPAVPSLFATLIRGVSPIRDADRSSIRKIFNTGSKIPPTLWNEVLDLFPDADISLNYGMTETYRSATLPYDQAREAPDAVGFALPGADVVVIGEDGREAPAGETGEIVHRGMGVFLGYWGEPERTAAVRRPDPLWGGDGVEPAPAVFSGDLGWKDDKGRLHVAGRRDRQIKSMGVRVSPDEVERLIEGTGLISEIAIVSRPHEVVGEQVLAVFSCKSPEDDPVRALKRAARASMSPFMQPMEWIRLEALPRTPSGKIDYAALSRSHGGKPGS